MKALIYARTSSDDAEDKANKISIDVQLEKAREYAATHQLQVVGEVSDRDRSGRTYPLIDSAKAFAENDTQFQEYFAEAIKRPSKKYRAGLGEVFQALQEIDCLVVYDETRLMRPLPNSHLASFIKQAFMSSNVAVHTVGQGVIDYADFSASLVSTISSHVEDNVLQKTREKSLASLKKKKDEGYLASGVCCYGYESGGHQKVDVVPHEAEVVKMIFDLFTKDKLPINQIVRKLNGDGVETKQGCNWTHNGILKVLRRETYAGLRKNSQGEYIQCVPLKGKNIILPRQFYAAQNQMNKHRFAGRSRDKDNENIHVLSGLVYCGNCGSKMHINKAKNYDGDKTVHYYICPNSNDKRCTSENKACRMARVREKSENGFKDEPLFENYGLVEIAQYLCVKQIAEGLNTDDAACEELKGKIEQLRHSVTEIDTHVAMLSDRLFDKKITEGQFDMMVAKYQTRKQEMETELSRAEAALAKLEGGLSGAELLRLLSDIRNNRIDSHRFREIAGDVFQSITVQPYSVEILFTDGSKFEFERVPVRNARMIPDFGFSIKATQENGSVDECEIRLLYKSAVTQLQERPGLSFDKLVNNVGVKTLYTSPFLRVVCVGKNPAPHEYAVKYKRREKSSNYEEMMEAGIVSG